MNKRLHFSSLKNVLCTALWVNCLIGFPLPWGELQRASPPIIQACITKKKTHSIPSELLGTNIEDQKSRRMKKRYIEVKSECKLERQKIRAETRVLRWRSSQILFWGFESLKELWILSVCSWNQKNKGWIKRINDWIVKKNLKKGCRQGGQNGWLFPSATLLNFSPFFWQTNQYGSCNAEQDQERHLNRIKPQPKHQRGWCSVQHNMLLILGLVTTLRPTSDCSSTLEDKIPFLCPFKQCSPGWEAD